MKYVHKWVFRKFMDDVHMKKNFVRISNLFAPKSTAFSFSFFEVSLYKQVSVIESQTLRVRVKI